LGALNTSRRSSVRLGVATPANRLLHAIVKLIESK
jgi:hypothetical protein